MTVIGGIFVLFLFAPVAMTTGAAQSATDAGQPVYEIGKGGASPPRVISHVEPEYSDEARRAHASGTVVVQVVVNESGQAQDFKFKRAIGLGLDEKAIEAIRQWRFEPGIRHDQAVKTYVTIEVNFRLLAQLSSPWTVRRLVFQTAEDVSRPVLLKSRLPQPGAGAREGKVSVTLEVGEDGKPRDVAIDKSSDPAYEKEILGAVRRWRFEPARRGALPLTAKGKLEVSRALP